MNDTQLAHYRQARAENPGRLVLFRLGDYYELFGDDARTAAKALGLTLTIRDGEALAGFPHTHLEAYLRRLLQCGHKIAVCDRAVEGSL